MAAFNSLTFGQKFFLACFNENVKIQVELY